MLYELFYEKSDMELDGGIFYPEAIVNVVPHYFIFLQLLHLCCLFHI